MQELNIKNY